MRSHCRQTVERSGQAFSRGHSVAWRPTAWQRVATSICGVPPLGSGWLRLFVSHCRSHCRQTVDS